MIDFVIGLLQGLAFVFVLYGACLVASWAGPRAVLKESIEPRVERRKRTRRKEDRRRELRQDLYGVPM